MGAAGVEKDVNAETFIQILVKETLPSLHDIPAIKQLLEEIATMQYLGEIVAATQDLVSGILTGDLSSIRADFTDKDRNLFMKTFLLNLEDVQNKYDLEEVEVETHIPEWVKQVDDSAECWNIWVPIDGSSHSDMLDFPLLFVDVDLKAEELKDLKRSERYTSFVAEYHLGREEYEDSIKYYGHKTMKSFTAGGDEAFIFNPIEARHAGVVPRISGEQSVFPTRFGTRRSFETRLMVLSEQA